MIRHPLTHASWLKAEKVGPVAWCFSFFLLFQTVFTVTANLLPEREPAEPTETGKLQVTRGAKTSDANYLIDSELACTLCVKYCPQKKIWALYEAVNVHSLFYSESHSNQSQQVGTTQTHKVANLNIVWTSWSQTLLGGQNKHTNSM